MNRFFFLILMVLVASCQIQIPKKDAVKITGELKKWHKVTLAIHGHETSEWARENPFLKYKLDVTFTNGGKTCKVPGYYAADGNAGETSSGKGKVWKVHFRPDKAGTWTYKISFRKGKNIAILDGEEVGEPEAFDGMEGKIEIAETDKTGDDFRANGRIVNGGKGYFNFQDSDKIWIKNGADSPENFLAYADFDQTYRFSLKTEVREGEADPKEGLHLYEPHVSDWKTGDPTWQNGKGKGIIGAINYLKSVGVNSVYMLTLNILGDGKDVWPYSDHNERYRFDCSKLDQWEIVFDYMEKQGMMVHFVLQETENECLLDNGYTDVQRKLYLRELVARFGHHLGVTWNLGEENGPADWTPVGQTDQQRKDMATFLKQVNPYPNIVVLHTHADNGGQDKFLTPLLGFENLDGPSMQVGNPAKVHERIKKWVAESEKTGKRWLVNLDEIGPHWKGAMPDSHDASHDTIRQDCLWGALLAGATGVEWYFGYRYPHTDLTCEDFRSRDNWWKQSTIATRFIQQFPLEKMKSADDPVNAKNVFCLANPGEIYLVYIPAGLQNTSIKLEGEKSFSVKWFNPREGGEMQDGNVTVLEGNGIKNVGNPPSEPEKDWVVVVQ